MKNSHIKSLEHYQELYKRSVGAESDEFWAEKAREQLTFFEPWTKVQEGGFEKGSVAWFLNGKLNVCYNCVDRHLKDHPHKTALIWEGNDVEKDQKKMSYQELFEEVCKLSNVLKSYGVRKGDAVAIYMPMVLEACVAMLACARIGAVHTVIFAGFSPQAIHDRLQDSKAVVVICADEGVRGVKRIPLKDNVDEAVRGLDFVRKVLVHRRTGGRVHWDDRKDVWLDEAMATQRPYCPVEWLDSEDALFLLYTSGSTGQPKGILHTQAGYLLYASLTHKYVFDHRPDDVYACVADVGWITGHSYIVYGPLCNGATSVVFEPTPLFPDAGRYWDCVARHKINSFYTSPTAIRALMKYGTEHVTKYDLSSLRVLGTVGEPINPAAWSWYHEHVGNKQCPVVDTYWQTETGGHMITPVPGVTPLTPGCATLPFFGIVPELLDGVTGQVIPASDTKRTGLLVMAKPWPSIGRTIYNDHQRYLRTYMQYPGYYFTGDGATMEPNGNVWINGRVDDVINVSGHRLGTAELESALGTTTTTLCVCVCLFFVLVNHVACPEAAVIAVPHDLKGQCVYCYCVLREGYVASDELRLSLSQQVVKEVGAFARPEAVIMCTGLPKTRSGKIMRRLLRKIAERQFDALGDTSTLADPTVVEAIVQEIKEMDARLGAAPQPKKLKE